MMIPTMMRTTVMATTSSIRLYFCAGSAATVKMNRRNVALPPQVAFVTNQRSHSSNSNSTSPSSSPSSSSSSSSSPSFPSSASSSIFRNTTVPNEGSIARDILAAERTFLAWGRTGLGFVGAGSALFAAYHNHEADENEVEGATSSINRNHRHANNMLDEVLPACGVLIGNGIFLLAFATHRYVTVVRAMQYHNNFPIHSGATLLAVAVTATGTLTSLAIVARARFAAIKAASAASSGGGGTVTPTKDEMTKES